MHLVRAAAHPVALRRSELVARLAGQ